MKIGLNAGFGELLAPEDLVDLQRLNTQIVRSEINLDVSDEYAREQLQQHVGQPWQLLILLSGGIGIPLTLKYVTHAVRLVRISNELGLTPWIEIGNEPNLGNASLKSPISYSIICRAVHKTLRDMGFTGEIITGGVSNTDKSGRDYLNGMAWATMPADMVAGVHRYPVKLNPHLPFKGFSSREDELEAVRDVVKGHRIAHTEGGYTTAVETETTGWWFWKKTTTRQLTDIQAADAIINEVNYWPDVLCFCYYQLNDGTTENAADRCGLRRVDKSWKPQAFAFERVT